MSCTPAGNVTPGLILYQPELIAASSVAFEGIIAMILGNSIPAPFDRCALVGSSADFRGKGYGPEIDGHDTVIRVNRITTEEYFQDYGQRTDVLFMGPRIQGQQMYTKTGQWYWWFGGERKFCAFKSADKLTECPFKAVIYKGWVGNWRDSWEDVYPWKPRRSTIPLAYQAKPVVALTFNLLRQFASKRGDSVPKRPTTGLEAFVTFGLLCKSLSLYGFSGVGTADGHAVGAAHSLETEHALLRSLAAGEVDRDWKLPAALLHRFVDRPGRHRIVQPGPPAPSTSEAAAAQLKR